MGELINLTGARLINLPTISLGVAKNSLLAKKIVNICQLFVCAGVSGTFYAIRKHFS